MAITVSANELHRIVSTAIIFRGKRFLLIKRSLREKAFPGKWTVPGGGLHPDDYLNLKPDTKSGQWYFALAGSLRREIKEETNLVVGELHYLCDLVFIRPDKIPVVVLSFFGPYKSGKIKLEDHDAYAWVTAKEAAKYDLIDGILEEIRVADKILSKKKIDKEKTLKKFLKS